MRPAWHLSRFVSIDGRCLFVYNFHFFPTLWHPRCYLVSVNVIFFEIPARPAKSRWDAKIRRGRWRYEEMASDCSARVLTSIPPHTRVAFSEGCVFTGKSKTITHPFWVAKVRRSNDPWGRGRSVNSFQHVFSYDISTFRVLIIRVMWKQMVRDFCKCLRVLEAVTMVNYLSRFGQTGSTNSFNCLTVYLLRNFGIKYTRKYCSVGPLDGSP